MSPATKLKSRPAKSAPAKSAPAKTALRRAPRQAAAGDSPRLLELIEAAEDIFLAKGYHTATMSDVARAAGMSKKTVYTLIDSKGELFATLLAHHQSRLNFPAARPEWTVRDILVTNLICLARFLLAPAQIAIIRLIMAEYTHSPDLGRVFHQKRLMMARYRLENCLIEIGCCPKGKLPTAKELSGLLFGMAIGEFMLSTLVGLRAAPGRAALERRVSEAVDMFMQSCDLPMTPTQPKPKP